MKQTKDSYNIVKELLEKTDQEVQKMPPVNILVSGKTGVGKSTLINHVFREKLADTGIGKPVTKHLRRITKKGVPIALYDTRGLELEPSVQATVKNEMFNLVEENKNSEEEIHVAYYCINANSNRIEQSEIDLINELSEKLPVILVLTQSIGKPAEEFQTYLENLNLSVVTIQRVMAEPYEIDEELSIPEFGLKELIHKTLELIPEEAHEAFTNAQIADIDRKAKSARRWAVKYIAATFGVGFSPIPFSDASVLVPMQVTLLAHITAIFGISLDKSSIVSIIAAVGGTGSATFVGKTVVANAFKFIPGIGTVIGGAISGGTAAALTSALAMSYIEVLTVLAKNDKEGKEINAQAVKELMQNRFRKNMKSRKNDIDYDQLKYTEGQNHKDENKLQRIGRALKRFIQKRN